MTRYKIHSARIVPAPLPLQPDMQEAIDGIMRTVPSPTDIFINLRLGVVLDALPGLARIRATRDFGASLFLTEEAFDADPQYTGVNPRPGRNLLEGLEDQLAFVERDRHWHGFAGASQ